MHISSSPIQLGSAGRAVLIALITLPELYLQNLVAANQDGILGYLCNAHA